MNLVAIVILFLFASITTTTISNNMNPSLLKTILVFNIPAIAGMISMVIAMNP